MLFVPLLTDIVDEIDSADDQCAENYRVEFFHALVFVAVAVITSAGLWDLMTELIAANTLRAGTTVLISFMSSPMRCLIFTR
jgi:hypothetical protein